MLAQSKSKTFAGDNINTTKKFEIVSVTVDNTVEKRENAGYQHFLFFPTMLSKGLLIRVLNLYSTTNFADDNFKKLMKMVEVVNKDRKNCGKRRNCLLREISPFPTMFSKDLYCRHIKFRACLGKG